MVRLYLNAMIDEMRGDSSFTTASSDIYVGSRRVDKMPPLCGLD